MTFGGVPAKTLVGMPRTSASVISNIVPGAHTAAQASSYVIGIGRDLAVQVGVDSPQVSPIAPGFTNLQPGKPGQERVHRQKVRLSPLIARQTRAPKPLGG